MTEPHVLRQLRSRNVLNPRYHHSIAGDVTARHVGSIFERGNHLCRTPYLHYRPSLLPASEELLNQSETFSRVLERCGTGLVCQQLELCEVHSRNAERRG
jgi:hypothetical protein